MIQIPAKCSPPNELFLTHILSLTMAPASLALDKQPGFCKFGITRFSNFKVGKSSSCFFFVDTVRMNGVLTEGTMWTCGCRKSLKKGEGFGRYYSVSRLAAMILKSQYNAKDVDAAYKEANKWIATHLQELAPQAFKEYPQALIENQLPSMGQTKYNIPYNMFDFAFFFTFTMLNLHNEPHIEVPMSTIGT
ncbi:hypothetical protein MJO29_016875 [Puccinia striiformis f. sp. tritici]|nr:hypothetical protein MJO29_016875 [Puccinia striiformis f. sp. tritici]